MGLKQNKKAIYWSLTECLRALGLAIYVIYFFDISYAEDVKDSCDEDDNDFCVES